MEGQLPSAGLSPLPVTGAVPLRPNRAEGYGSIAERFYLRTADHSPRETDKMKSQSEGFISLSRGLCSSF